MALATEPGPGAAGVKASLEAAAGFIVTAEVMAVVTPLMLTGVATKVYVPEVFMTRLENVATPLLRAKARDCFLNLI